MQQRLRIGDWRVDAVAGTITRGPESQGETLRVDERLLRVLLCLAARRGETVSSEELLEAAWPGVAVSQDSVYQAVAALRRLLGDDSKQRAYIVTAPRKGYRLVAAVEPWLDEPVTPMVASEPVVNATSAERNSRSIVGRRLSWLAAAAALLVAGALWLHLGSSAKPAPVAAAAVAQPARSIAVVPFLDLTEGMKEEEFADGMTEELIGRLSKIPGMRVSGPTASFYFKDKQVAPAEIGRTLGVAYLLDGSVRKAGKRLRVSARLLRADTSYVVWTESYDRSLDDILKVQDEIAGKVTQALRGSLDAGSGTR